MPAPFLGHDFKSYVVFVTNDVSLWLPYSGINEAMVDGLEEALHDPH